MSLTVNRRWRGKFGQFLNIKGQYKIDSIRSVFGILILVPPLNIYPIDSEYTRIYTRG